MTDQLPGIPTPQPRPPLKAELLAENRAFIALAGELLRTFRNNDSGACALCGAPKGLQHYRRAVCFQLASWGASTQYKDDDSE